MFFHPEAGIYKDIAIRQNRRGLSFQEAPACFIRRKGTKTQPNGRILVPKGYLCSEN